MAVVLDICHSTLLIVNIYLPPPFQPQLLFYLLAKLAPYAHIPLVLMGDFNSILDAALDSSNPNRLSSTELLSWASTVGLSELLGWKHPATRCYSHLSRTHCSLARINLAFGNPSLLSLLHNTDYLAGGLSDHNPLSITLAFPTGSGRGACRLYTGWLQVDQISSHLQTFITSYWSINADSAEPPVVWEVFKAVVWGECISAIKTARKDHNVEIVALQEKECEFAEEHAESSMDVSYTSLLEAPRLLSVHYVDLAHTESRHKTLSLFAQGDKNGKLLAMLVVDHKPPTNIPTMSYNGGIYAIFFRTLCIYPTL